MSVLDDIIAGVREDMAARRSSLASLQEKMDQVDEVRDALPALRRTGISLISEVKRSSPSKGSLATIADPASLAQIYEGAGAAVVSVLTEGRRFGGSLADLVAVRESVSIPVLRKDFMVDEYQFYEARAHGADLVLLIVAALSQNQLKDFAELTRALHMRAIVEVHSQDELDRALEISPDIIGVNSRNLKDLSVDAKVFSQLIPMIPANIVRVAESGIATRGDVVFAHQAGADAVLIGEALVRGSDPAITIRTLLND
ncbi:MAG: indole-3-glycerol phosphate synthase TrpC [Actinobacteria bacterium]|nr:indole-3-glycerol phosphate synthase TrpC [Actinomycetota bacterium]